MTEEKLIHLSAERLHELIAGKLQQAGLQETHADEVANHLVFADLCGIHSHGAVRVEYYAERINKGGTTIQPQISFEQTGPSTGIFHGDNGVGQYIANEAIAPTIKLAKETGVAVVGVSRMSHSGTLAYYVEKIAKEDLIAIAMTNSDPMVVPFGGSENYFGTNPIGFAAPRKNAEPVVFDMATTVQAWGKILDARSKNKEIPDTWAVDKEGNPTTDPYQVSGLLPISGPKGYGLMMIVDILSASLFGLPFGKHVTSMYHDLTAGRELGQIYIVIDPAKFTDVEAFKARIDQMVNELHAIAPAKGFDQVYYPGEISLLTYQERLKDGVDIPESIVAYLESDTVHYNRYDGKGSFA